MAAEQERGERKYRVSYVTTRRLWCQLLCLQWSRCLFEHAGMWALKRTRVSLHILTEMWLYVFAADVQHEREQVVFTSGESIDSSAALKHILLFYMSEGGIVLFLLHYMCYSFHLLCRLRYCTENIWQPNISTASLAYINRLIWKTLCKLSMYLPACCTWQGSSSRLAGCIAKAISELEWKRKYRIR